MVPENRPENENSETTWSMLDGEFTEKTLIDSQARLKEIEAKSYEQWGHGDRVLVYDLVLLAISSCQPDLFRDNDPEIEKEIGRVIGTSAFACYNYTTEQMDKVAEIVSDIPNSQIPALKAVETLIIQASVVLGESKDLSAICRTTILHILAKQKGREAELPRAVYNKA